MSTYLETMNKQNSDLKEVANKLSSLCSAFYVTGNTEMSNTLHKLANLCYDIEENIAEAVEKELNRAYYLSQEASANMLGACLAMVENNND